MVLTKCMRLRHVLITGNRYEQRCHSRQGERDMDVIQADRHQQHTQIDTNNIHTLEYNTLYHVLIITRNDIGEIKRRHKAGGRRAG